MQKNLQLGLTAAIVIGIGILMTTPSLAPAAFAHKHHSGSHISVHQSIHQANIVKGSCGDCENNAVNNVNFGSQSGNTVTQGG